MNINKKIIKETGSTIDGIKVGDWKIFEKYSTMDIWNNSFELREEQSYDNQGQKTGIWKLHKTSRYKDSGTTTFLNNKKDGTELGFYDDKIQYEKIYSNGELISSIEYLHNAEKNPKNLIVKTEYKDNEMTKIYINSKTSNLIVKNTYKINKNRNLLNEVINRVKELTRV